MSALIDPTSAQFRAEKFVANSNGSALCGDVNARNSFGGYVGYRAFVVTAEAVLLAPESVRQDAESLQQQLAFLTAMRRHCFTEAEIAGRASRHPLTKRFPEIYPGPSWARGLLRVTLSPTGVDSYHHAVLRSART